MSYFQYIGLAVFAWLILVDIIGMIRGRSGPAVSAAWLLLWVLGAGAMIMPDATTQLAKSLGIQRGTDLVLYLAVLSGLVWSFFSFVRFRKLDRQVTLIVRRIAMDNVQLPIEPAPTAQDEQ